MFGLRDHDRYVGKIVELEGIGECLVSVGIAGFGESLSVDKDGENIFYGEYLEGIEEDYEEDEESFTILVGYPYYREVVVPKEKLYK